MAVLEPIDMDNALKSKLLTSYSWIGEQAARVAMIEAAAKHIGLEEAVEGVECYVGLTTYGDNRPEIAIYLYDQRGMQEMTKRLLPKVGKFVKGFDEAYNQVTLTAEVRGVTLKLAMSTPSTCTVETVTEEVEVAEQVIPAHTEKKTRYVLKGDCDPIMASEDEIAALRRVVAPIHAADAAAVATPPECDCLGRGCAKCSGTLAVEL
jgi:hypothetical protein